MRASGVLLVPLLVVGCSFAGESKRSREGEQATPPTVSTTPAGGLWSQRFVGWPDGRVTAIGFSRAPAGIGLVHLRPTGKTDSSFPRVVHSEFGAGKLDALAATRSGAGTLFIAGCQPPDCWGYFVLGRFRRDGSRDPSFGQDGLVRTSFPGGSLEPRAITLQADGKIVVAGELWIESDSSRRGFLARFLPDGRGDEAFGNGGLLLTQLGGITAVATQADGRIVAVGRRFHLGTRPASSSVEVARYLRQGRVDVAFGVRGVARVPGLWSGESALIDKRERILIAGSAQRSLRPALGIVRLTAAGTLDRAFGDGGRALHSRPGDHAASAEALMSLSHGRLAVTGWAVRGKTVLERRYRLVVLLLQSSGRLVRVFGEDGRMTLGGVEVKGQAAFLAKQQRLVTVGADDDLQPRQIVFATVVLPH